MRKLLLAALLIFSGLSLTGCGSSETRSEADDAVSEYNAAAEKANQAVADYNDAADAFAARNAELETAILNAQDAADSGGVPFDDKTLTCLQDEIRSAAGVEQTVPEKLTTQYEEMDPPGRAMSKSDLEGQIEKAGRALDDLDANPVPDAPEIPDYTGEITALETAASAYEDSVAGYLLALTPSEDYVIERLSLLDTITDIEAEPADEKAESPNDRCQGCVYFTDSRVDQFALYIRGKDPKAAETGVKGGGCVKLYDSEKQAQTEDEELSGYDGTIFGGGSHRVVGAMLIQISNLLSTEEQLQLMEEITEALLLPAV